MAIANLDIRVGRPWGGLGGAYALVGPVRLRNVIGFLALLTAMMGAARDGMSEYRFLRGDERMAALITAIVFAALTDPASGAIA